MKISEILQKRERPTLSFELFPPKGQDVAIQNDAIQELGELGPDFMSITCGALGSQTPTVDFAIAQNEKWDFPVMPHLTSAGLTVDEQIALIIRYKEAGIDDILALRGDLTEQQKITGYSEHALDLVKLIKEHHEVASIGVAAHPEKHPESKSLETDREHLVTKLDLAKYAIGQFAFSPDIYVKLLDDLHKLGCDKPVIPGIILFTSAAGLYRIASLNNTTIPEKLRNKIDRAKTSADIAKLVVETAGILSEELLAQGAPGIHVYTLNRSGLATELCRQLSGSLKRA